MRASSQSFSPTLPDADATYQECRTIDLDTIEPLVALPDAVVNNSVGISEHIVAKLVEAVQDPRTHRYSVSKGIPGLRRALAAYYQRRFDVGLDPETEVIATLGSKEGLANLASASRWCPARCRCLSRRSTRRRTTTTFAPRLETVTARSYQPKGI